MSFLARASACCGLLLFLLSAWSVSAQTLQGTVRSPDGDPIVGVQIVVPATGQGVVTGSQGNYVLNGLPAGVVEVHFRFLGFRTEIRRLEVLHSEEVRLDVVLIPEAIQVEGIVVTAEGQAEAMLKRSTRSVSVMETGDLEELRGQTLGEMLAELPGVTTLSTGPSIAKPVVRGLHSQRLVILNAGVAQEGQQWGGEHAPEIDPFSAQRVEVIKGAAGVEYGVGAIGGVIRLEPGELPFRQRLRGRVMANAFSNNRQGALSALLEGGTLGWPGLGWRVQSSVRRAGDSRAPDYVLGNTGFREFDAKAELGYEGTRMGWHAHFSHFETMLGLFRGAHIGNVDDLLRAIERGEPAVDYEFTYAIDAPKQVIRHDVASVRGHVKIPSGDWLEAQYAYQNNHREEFDAHARFGSVTDGPAFALTLRTHSLDLKLRQKPRGRRLGVLGVSLMNQANVNGEAGQLIPNFRAITGGAFIRETWVSGPLTLEGGARVDHRWMEAWPREDLARGDFVRRTRSWTSASGVVGVIWQFSDHWSVSSNLATAWRPPGVNELFNFGVHHGTAQFEVGDPDLGAEHSLSLDATLRHLSDSWTAEVSAYVNRMDGYIYLRPEAEPRVTISGSFPSFRYDQTDALLSGLDGAITVSIRPWLRASGQFSLVRGQDRGHDEPLILMPADRVKMGLSADLRPWLELGASMQGVARQNRYPEGLDYADPPSGYALLGLDGQVRIPFRGDTLLLFVSMDNALNTSYRDYLSRFRYFIDDPGRTVALRLSVPIGNQTN